jgi:hypothetical protein
MFESFSSVDSSRTTPTEWLLARIAGREQAAAIMGDLEELSATRSKSWFWTTYARTLITLGWRTPVAFLIAMVSMRFIFRTLILLLMIHRTSRLSDASLSDMLSTHARIVLYNCLINAARFLVFALPFVVVRFGLRNRLTQLTCALLLIAVPVYTLRPLVMDLSGILIVVAVVAALLTPLWRKPLIVLAATCTTAMAAIVTYFFVLVGVFHQNIITVSESKMPYQAIGLALAAIVCVWMHRVLLQRPPVTDRNLA